MLYYLSNNRTFGLCNASKFDDARINIDLDKAAK